MSGPPPVTKPKPLVLSAKFQVKKSEKPRPPPQQEQQLDLAPSSNVAVVAEDKQPYTPPTSVPTTVGMFKKKIGDLSGKAKKAAEILATAREMEEKAKRAVPEGPIPLVSPFAVQAKPIEEPKKVVPTLRELELSITQDTAKIFVELGKSLDEMKRGGVELTDMVLDPARSIGETSTYVFEDPDDGIPLENTDLAKLDPFFRTMVIRSNAITGKGDFQKPSALKQDYETLFKLIDYSKKYLAAPVKFEGEKQQRALRLLLDDERVKTLIELEKTLNEMRAAGTDISTMLKKTEGNRTIYYFEDEDEEIPIDADKLEDLKYFFRDLRITPKTISGVGDYDDPDSNLYKDLQTLTEVFGLAHEYVKQKETQVEKLLVKEAAEAKTLEGTPFEGFAEEIEAEKHKEPYEVTTDSDYKPTRTGTDIIPKQTGFIPTSRRAFGYFIRDKFRSYTLPELPAEIDFDACMKMVGKDAAATAEIYSYQKFVRDYISYMTPYRGVLVYHGLGSGKTCTAIAAAEALFASGTKKRIIVMTPFSLRKNFIQQITFCGFRHFRLLNYWQKFPYSKKDGKNALWLFATTVLNIPESYMEKTKQVWIPDFTQKENYTTLLPEEQFQIREQINNILIYEPSDDPRKKKNGLIWFINYNGISATKLRDIACKKPGPDVDNFDNAVIIVDEIHNLIRLMQGTIDPYLSQLAGIKRKVPLEPVTYQRWEPKLCNKSLNYKRGYLFYRLLVGAQNSKIIGLSGTPLINFPEELGILANILHGYLHIVEALLPSLGVQGEVEKYRAGLKRVGEYNPYIDFYEIQPVKADVLFTFTFLPEGYRKIEGELGVEHIPEGEFNPTFEERISIVRKDLSDVMSSIKKDKIFEGKMNVRSEPLLPPFAQPSVVKVAGTGGPPSKDDSFKGNFLQEDGVNLKNKNVLLKRLSGLISYYKGSRKDLMPEVTKDEIVKVDMSQYQQDQYTKIRLEEIDIEKKKESLLGDTAGMIRARGDAAWVENFELPNLRSSQNYRMASRQACNFVFPPGITRPRPVSRAQYKDSNEFGGDINKMTEVVDTEAVTQEPSALVGTLEEELEQSRQDQEAENKADQEDESVDEQDQEEYLKEQKARLQKEGKSADQIKDALSRMKAELALQRESGAILASPETSVGPEADLTPEEKRCRANILPDESYQKAMDRSKNCLLEFARNRLLIADPDDPSRPSPLEDCSPKFKAILENILQAKGSSLVYSQFLGMEGIGIFTIVMQANGFDPIIIRSEKVGKQFTFVFSPESEASIRLGPQANRPRFILFTGGEAEEVRKVNIDLFNANFDSLPPEILKVIMESGYKGNKIGELCRVFCITSAGAEGLSLKNVRAVHIMEPYWNDVRMAQVKGRAVRICSHMDLKPEERTVEVFTYISCFSRKAQEADEGPERISEEVRQRDSLDEQAAYAAKVVPSKKKKQYVMTSDERLFVISERKKELIQNLTSVMKATSADCLLNYKQNKDGTYICRLFGNTGDFLYHPDLEKDKEYAKELEEDEEVAEKQIEIALQRTKSQETAFEREEAEREAREREAAEKAKKELTEKVEQKIAESVRTSAKTSAAASKETSPELSAQATSLVVPLTRALSKVQEVQEEEEAETPAVSKFLPKAVPSVQSQLIQQSQPKPQVLPTPARAKFPVQIARKGKVKEPFFISPVIEEGTGKVLRFNIFDFKDKDLKSSIGRIKANASGKPVAGSAKFD